MTPWSPRIYNMGSDGSNAAGGSATAADSENSLQLPPLDGEYSMGSFM
jgi:hypothetical protein